MPHMKTTTLDREIRTRIDSFLADLSNLVKTSTLQAVHGALGAAMGNGVSATIAAPSRGPGRPRKGDKRGKRTTEDVLKTADAVLAYVTENNGQRLEEISRGLSISTKNLKLPVAKLMEGKKLRTKGAKRGMRYFAR